VVEQTECLKSWIRQVIKSSGFTTVNVAVKTLNIEEGLGTARGNDIGNNQAVDEEYKV
jgi:hypothetical protein